MKKLSNVCFFIPKKVDNRSTKMIILSNQQEKKIEKMAVERQTDTKIEVHIQCMYLTKHIEVQLNKKKLQKNQLCAIKECINEKIFVKNYKTRMIMFDTLVKSAKIKKAKNKIQKKRQSYIKCKKVCKLKVLG